MTSLELQLVELGGRLEYPPTPDLTAAVAARIAERRPRFSFSRRTLAVGVAVLAAAAAATMVVPQARTSVLEWLGLREVPVVRVDELPEVPPRRRLALGTQVSLAEARRLARHAILVPRRGGLRKPDAIFVDVSKPGRPVSFLYGSLERPRLLLSEFRGELLFEKLVGPGTKIDSLFLNGRPAVWFEGRRHVFVYRDEYGEPAEGTMRLAANTLLWHRAELLLRLEGKMTKKDAIEVARSLR